MQRCFQLFLISFSLAMPLAHADFTPEESIEFLLIKRGIPKAHNPFFIELKLEMHQDSALQILVKKDESNLESENEKYREDRAQNLLETDSEKYIHALLIKDAEQAIARPATPVVRLVSLSEAMKKSFSGGLVSKEWYSKFILETQKRIQETFTLKPEIFQGENAVLFSSYLDEKPYGNDLSTEIWNRNYPYARNNELLTQTLFQYRKEWLAQPEAHLDQLLALVENNHFALGENLSEDGSSFIRNLYAEVSNWEAPRQAPFLKSIDFLSPLNRIRAWLAVKTHYSYESDFESPSFYRSNALNPELGLHDALNREIFNLLVPRLLDSKKILELQPYQFRYLQEMAPETAILYQKLYLKTIFIPKLSLWAAPGSFDSSVNRAVVQNIFKSGDSESQAILSTLALDGKIQTPQFERVKDIIDQNAKSGSPLWAKKEFAKTRSIPALATYLHSISSEDLVIKLNEMSGLMESLEKNTWKQIYPNSRARFEALMTIIKSEENATAFLDKNTLFTERMIKIYQSALEEIGHFQVSPEVMTKLIETHARTFKTVADQFAQTQINGAHTPSNASFQQIVKLHSQFIFMAERLAVQKSLRFHEMKSLVSEFRNRILKDLIWAAPCELVVADESGQFSEN